MPRPSNLRGKVAMVTGASSGIGRALARGLADHGATVWAVGRRQGRLEALHDEAAAAGGRLRSYPCDLAELNEVTGLVDNISNESGQLDIVVNNAGVMATGSLPSLSDAVVQETQTINGTVPMVVTRAVFELLRKTATISDRQVSDLMFVGSTAAKVGFSGGSVYNFSKFGIAGFSEAVRHEFREHGIRVSTIHPGTTATELFAASRIDDYLPTCAPQDTEYSLAPETVASMMIHILEQPRHVCIPEVTVCPTGDKF